MAPLNTLESPTRSPIKRILVLSYSQTGQLADITQSIVAPLQQSGHFAVHIETLRPVKPYPFPWRFFSFLDAFPESAQLVAPALQPLTLTEDEYFDLVILPYQVWFCAFVADYRLSQTPAGQETIGGQAGGDRHRLSQHVDAGTRENERFAGGLRCALARQRGAG
jgi:hypothetical protein